ncbi:MAG: mandelate racemase/muconate lactonizing enzyme family protein [Microthrixaceae bacterium]
MLITEVETFAVRNPPPSHGGPWFLFVVLRTDNGSVGVGEAYIASVGPHAAAVVLEDVAERHLLGHDPFRIESFVRRARSGGYSPRPDPTLMGAVSALEMACWDIIGKEVGRPVHDLIGGRVRDSIRAYTYLYPRPGDDGDVYTDPHVAAARAVEEVERGFTAVKLDPAGPYSAYDGRQPSLARLDLTEAMVAAVRDAVGARADICVGTHGQFTYSGALRLARRLESHDPLWFEEPTPPEDPEQMARVAAGTSIPVATGERLCTMDDFVAVLRAGAASILQPNLGRAGGILEGRKIAALAEVHGAQVAPHLYCGPVVAAANINVAAVIPNLLVLEAIGDFSGFHAELLETPIRVEDGFVIPSAEPGLGVVLDEKVARAHRYEGNDLHLAPATEPPAWND